jgi:AraC family transcriptional regulator, transcriptional activator FtrA
VAPTSVLKDNERKKTDLVLKRDERENKDMTKTSARHHVVTVLADGMSALEPSVAHDFLGDDRSYLGLPWYRYSLCAAAATPIRIGPITTIIDNGLATLRRADTIVIPGWCSRDTPPPSELVHEIRRASSRGARLVSFCTGALVLAEAGLLDGRPATTHWSFGPEFQRRYPQVNLDPTVLYVDDGQVLTSAGAAASIDLSLHLIRRDFGAEIANTVAREMVVPAHREGCQAQYIETPMHAGSGDLDDLFACTLDWAAAHLDEDLSVEQLAGQAALSPRQYTRQFKARTGTTPHQWVLTQRTALAQRLLESTDTPIEQVATATGFGTAAALRLQFRRALQTSPTAYRRCFDHTCDIP